MKRAARRSVCSLLMLASSAGCAQLGTRFDPEYTRLMESGTRPSAVTSIRSIGVFVKNESGVPARKIEDFFIQVLMKKGYMVATRSDLESVVKEQQLQKSGLTAQDAVQVGRILNVDGMLLVEVSELAWSRTQDGKPFIRSVAMGARLVGVESGRILWNEAKSQNSNLVQGVVDLPLTLIGLQDDVFDRLSWAIVKQLPDAT